MNITLAKPFLQIPIFKSIKKIDPRWLVFLSLASYLILGFTVLGFNRTPYQALVTTLSCALLEVGLHYYFKKKWIFPLSAMITSCSLSLLLNYSHDYFILLIPVFFAIVPKYLITFNGKHIFNPAQIAVTLSLLFTNELVTSAPAYQWYGVGSMSVFIAMLFLLFVLPTVNRHYLVLSFLGFFTINTFIRALIMKHHLPFETLFLGTLSSPPFFLFSFFMITDPATSPNDRKEQVKVGFLLALLDLLFHLKQSYYTFFYAGATIQTWRFLKFHWAGFKKTNLDYLFQRFILSGHYKRWVMALIMVVSGIFIYRTFIQPKTFMSNVNFTTTEIMPTESGINPKLGDTLLRVDKRVQHLAKWLLSVGDAVAVGDYNNDGLMDLFFTFPIKADGERNALYKNLGDFKFEKIEITVIRDRSIKIEENGLASNAMFVDFDSDGDQDLFLSYAFGSSVLLENQNGEFRDVTKKWGLDHYTNSITATFFDFNKDGLLDLFIGNVWPKNLPDYKPHQKLNLFKLPEPEFEGDERMFNFMHASWHMSNNGGRNELYLREKDKFKKLNSKKLGMPETRWSLALGVADFNQDGWHDIYVANDFGADDLYYNEQGKKLKNIKGKIFGDIGRDTYKGMNATILDVDNNGMTDVYISNVHHEMQAEGSLLWMFFKDKSGEVTLKEMATKTGALNESRFGWGAAALDLNNDGATDLIQANGMVDDTPDKVHDECPDYWYVNEKIARSPPSYHRYTNKWGDIRGYCIYGKEKNRVYFNQEDKLIGKFVDVADSVGVTKETNSRGVAAVDLNNDGSMDFVITHQFAPPSIYKTIQKNDHHWIGFKLIGDGKTCNTDAIGSKITIYYGEKSQMKELALVNGFSAQSDRRIHFGLKNYQGELKVVVDWCLAYKQEFNIKALDQYLPLKMSL
jgi:Na+-translocating ferredoxin:NAD+ oxidoreductase RnfD subunit